MSRLLRDDGRTLRAKVYELMDTPEQPDPEELLAFVEVLFDGRLIREAIRLRQESLEEMRPLPTSFDSLIDLIAHLLDLDFLTVYPMSREEDPEQARSFRAAFHKHNIETVTRHLDERLEIEMRRNFVGSAYS